MQNTTIRALIALNNRFYREHAESFSATRAAPWQGWRRVVDAIARCAGAAGGATVLDLACGNMRLARYLEAELPAMRITYHGVDDCDPLAGAEAAGAEAETPGSHVSVRFHHLDILAAVLEGGADALAGLAIPPADAACCFGFMHHVPGASLRADVARLLVRAARPGGIAVFSFWQFMDDERLASKARAVTRAAARGLELERDDYLLGWQHDADALRYCHHFTEDQIDALAADLAPDARELCRFSADGRTGRLNRYLIVQRL